MIHHLNCATFNPLLVGRMVCHVLLVERPGGLLLVDSGVGTADLATPARLGRPFVAAMRPALDPAETALAQVERLGFSADDVTDIAVTHLDLDHAGGIGDFSRARVHVYDSELKAALDPSVRDKARYVQDQFRDADLVTHHVAGDEWFGFESVAPLEGGSDDVLLVPLHGHSVGHCGVAVRDADDTWLLHAGDSYFHTSEKEASPRCPRTLATFQRLVAADDKARRANQERLRSLHADHGDRVTVFSAHDPLEFEAIR